MIQLDFRNRTKKSDIDSDSVLLGLRLHQKTSDSSRLRFGNPGFYFKYGI